MSNDKAKHTFYLYGDVVSDASDRIARTCESGCLDEVTDFYQSSEEFAIFEDYCASAKYKVTVTVERVEE